MQTITISKLLGKQTKYEAAADLVEDGGD